MTTKSFDKLSNKKLKALLETASDEDKVAIQEVLDARTQKTASQADASPVETSPVDDFVFSAEPEKPLTPEEQAALDAAEAAAEKGEKQVAGKKSLSAEEIEALVAKAKENLHSKCLILPAGEIEWVPGVIVGVTLDKRSNNIMYRIKAGEKYSHKEISAKTLQILPEKVEMTRSNTGRTSGEKRTDEQAEAMLSEAKANKGRYMQLADEKFLILGVVRDKRSNAVMYRVKNSEGKEGYKVVNATGLVLLDEWNDDIKNRAERVVTAKDPKDQLAEAKEKLEKAKAQVAKLEELIAKLEVEVAALPEQPAEEPTAEQSAEEPTAEADNDLM